MISDEEARTIIETRRADGEQFPAAAILNPALYLDEEDQQPPTIDCPHPEGSPDARRWWRNQWAAAIRHGDIEPRPEDATPAKLPPFPIDALPDPMRAVAVTIAENRRVPVDLPALLTISSVATVAGPRITIHRGKDWYEPLIEWTLTVAESGEGKSPAVAVIADILHDVERFVLTQHHQQVEARAGELEAEIAALTKAKTNMSADEADRVAEHVRLLNDELEAIRAAKPPRLLTGGSSTLEAVERAMADNGGHIAIVDDEGGAFGIITGVYNNGIPTGLDTILKAYGATRVPANERITRAVEAIPRAVLTYGITAQAVTLAGSFRSPSLRERGFHARWCYAVPEPVVGRRPVDPPALNYDAIDDFTDLLRNIARNPIIDATQPRRRWPTLELSHRARKLHMEMQAELEPRLEADTGDLAFMGDWANKYAGRVLRHAGLLHLAAGHDIDEEVSEQTMRDALTIGEWAMAHAGEVYRRAPKLPNGRRRDGDGVPDIGPVKVRRWIEKNKRIFFTTRDLYNSVRRQSWCGAAEDAQASLQVLEADGLVRKVPRLGSDGRQLPHAPWWVAHPDLVYGR